MENSNGISLMENRWKQPPKPKPAVKPIAEHEAVVELNSISQSLIALQKKITDLKEKLCPLQKSFEKLVKRKWELERVLIQPQVIDSRRTLRAASKREKRKEEKELLRQMSSLSVEELQAIAKASRVTKTRGEH